MESLLNRLMELTPEEKAFILMLLEQVTVKGTQDNAVQVAQMCHSVKAKLSAEELRPA